MARTYQFIKSVAEQIMACYILEKPLDTESGIEPIDEAVKELAAIYDFEDLASQDEDHFKAHLTVMLNFYQRAEPYQLIFAKHFDEIQQLDDTQLEYLAIRIQLYGKERREKS